MRALFIALLLAAFAVRAIGRPTLRPIDHPTISGYVSALHSSELTQVLSVSYTHIIVGGGTAGLALASRLSEHSHNKVLVLEAGTHQINNTNLTIPALGRQSIGTELDWEFETVPQINANNRTVSLPRGKVVGGTTIFNFMAWTRGFKEEYSAWAELAGSEDWSFKKLLAFFKRSESFTAPGPDNQNITRTFAPSAHGSSGPVHTSYGPFIPTQMKAFAQAVLGLGVPAARDFCDGKNVGVSWFAQSVDPRGQTRVTSDSAYIAPIAVQRKNLIILSSAQATRMLWKHSANSENKSLKVASGVEFIVGTSTHTVHSTGEVILSAGAIQSPQLLELSGVGDPAILGPLGIDTIIDLPGVGANLQDHPLVTLVYELKSGLSSFDTLGGAALAEAVAEYAKGEGILTSQLYTSAYLPAPLFLSPRDRLTALALLSVRSRALPANQQAALHSLYTKHAPLIELLPLNVNLGFLPSASNTSYISLAVGLAHPLARGTIHIASRDPLVKPAINPNYIDHPFDAFILNRGAQYARKVFEKTELVKFVERETEPGRGVQSDDEFAEWVKQDVRTQHHPVGTAAMLPREEGGVVDSDLLVHGTANVRVVDLSVLPILVSTHMQSVAYMIGEKAADIINNAQHRVW